MDGATGSSFIAESFDEEELPNDKRKCSSREIPPIPLEHSLKYWVTVRLVFCPRLLLMIPVVLACQQMFLCLLLIPVAVINRGSVTGLFQSIYLSFRPLLKSVWNFCTLNSIEIE